MKRQSVPRVEKGLRAAQNVEAVRRPSFFPGCYPERRPSREIVAESFDEISYQPYALVCVHRSSPPDADYSFAEPSL